MAFIQFIKFALLHVWSLQMNNMSHFAYNQSLSSWAQSSINAIRVTDDNSSFIFILISISILHVSPFLQNVVSTNYIYFEVSQKDLWYDLSQLWPAYILFLKLIPLPPTIQRSFLRLRFYLLIVLYLSWFGFVVCCINLLFILQQETCPAHIF